MLGALNAGCRGGTAKAGLNVEAIADRRQALRAVLENVCYRKVIVIARREAPQCPPLPRYW